MTTRVHAETGSLEGRSHQRRMEGCGRKRRYSDRRVEAGGEIRQAGVAAIAGFIHPGGDCGDAGSGGFRLVALGNEWAVRGDNRGFDNVVLLADDVVQGLRVRTRVYRAIERRNPDGATCVTLDRVTMLSKDEWGEAYGKPFGQRDEWR